MDSTTRFRDRTEGGRLLAEALMQYRGQDVLVLGIPRGGLPVAVEVARALEAELDIIVARKLGAPGQPELAIGAVTANGGQYLNDAYIDELAVSPKYLDEEIERKMVEARDRESRLRGQRPAPRINGRVVIVVDDGLATGATMRAALRSVRQSGPSTLVMAAPVGAPESCDAMQSEADEVVCSRQPPLFHAVGAHYEHFETVEDAEVGRILEEFAAERLSGGGSGSQRSIEVEFRNNVGYRLIGTLELPDGTTPVPVVVFAHGMGSGRTSGRNRAIAERLLHRGIASFLIDFTGHGDSEGTPDEASIERTAGDLASAITILEERSEVDRERIGVSGSSTGGIVALVAAAGDARVKALVLRSVPASGLDDVARNIRVPTLVIAGERDTPIVQDDEVLASLIAGEHRFIVIPEAGHLFEGPGQAQLVAEHSADWFAAQLGTPVAVEHGASQASPPTVPCLMPPR